VQNMVGQIVVSVAAAVCVGFITNAYFEEKPASTLPAAVQAADHASVDVSARADETAAEPSKIVVGNESEAYKDRAPSRPLVPEVATASPIRNVAEQPMPAATAPAAEMQAVALPPLDSQTIIDLPVRDVDQATKGAEIFPGVPSENALAEALRAAPVAGQRPERRRFLGLPIPNFVPTPGQFVETASAAGGKIITMVEGQ
jgi:hypothetical protein